MAGVAFVGLTFYVVLRWTGVCSAGLLAALLVTVDRHCISYAQEARPYAWVQLAGLLHVFLFCRLLYQPNRLRRMAWVGLGILLFYLHYTSVLLLAAESAYYGLLHVYRPWRPAYRPRSYGLDCIALCVGLLPATPHLLEIAARRDAWALFVRNDQPGKMALDMATSLGCTVYVVVPLVVLLLARSVRWYRWRSEGSLLRTPFPDARLLVLAGCWLLVPMIVAWTATTWDAARVFFFRYLIASAIAPVIVAAFCQAACPPGLWRVILAVTVLGVSIHQSGMIQQCRYDGRLIGDRNQDWRSAVRMLNREPGDAPVFIRSGLIEAERLRTCDDLRLRRYCLLPVRGIYWVERDENRLIPLPTVNAGRLSAAHRKVLLECGGGWFLLVGSPTGVAAIERDLLAGWTSYGVSARIAERRCFGNVTVLRIVLEPRRWEPLPGP
jgi:hypothetical protein